MTKLTMAWGLYENGKLGQYYGMRQVYLTKKLAEINQRYYNNEILKHKFVLKRIKITVYG